MCAGGGGGGGGGGGDPWDDEGLPAPQTGVEPSKVNELNLKKHVFLDPYGNRITNIDQAKGATGIYVKVGQNSFGKDVYVLNSQAKMVTNPYTGEVKFVGYVPKSGTTGEAMYNWSRASGKDKTFQANKPEWVINRTENDMKTLEREYKNAKDINEKARIGKELANKGKTISKWRNIRDQLRDLGAYDED
jgi:hypothetical protein